MLLVDIDKNLIIYFKYIKLWEIAFIEINPNFRLSKIIDIIKNLSNAVLEYML